jgi:hypothetical protein
MSTTMCDLGYEDANSDILRSSENAFSNPIEWINSVALSKITVAEGFSSRVLLAASRSMEVWLRDITNNPSSDVCSGLCADADKI